jgi:hypothetical protein
MFSLRKTCPWCGKVLAACICLGQVIHGGSNHDPHSEREGMEHAIPCRVSVMSTASGTGITPSTGTLTTSGQTPVVLSSSPWRGAS